MLYSLWIWSFGSRWLIVTWINISNSKQFVKFSWYLYTKNPQVVIDLLVENKFHCCRLWKVFSPVVFLCQVARTHRLRFQNSMDLFVYSEKKWSTIIGTPSHTSSLFCWQSRLTEPFHSIYQLVLLVVVLWL